MFVQTIKQMKTAILLLLVFSFLTGIAYPWFVTLTAQLIFPWQANGSLIKQQNKIVGSELIGQHFDLPQYFWGRPSATKPFPYNAASSGASNLGPLNADLLNNIKLRINIVRKANPDATGQIPVEMVTTSASGLDPDISFEMALYQVPRIAKARKIESQKIDKLIKSLIKANKIGFFGQDRINVLQLNLALDNLGSSKGFQ